MRLYEFSKNIQLILNCNRLSSYYFFRLLLFVFSNSEMIKHSTISDSKLKETVISQIEKRSTPVIGIFYAVYFD